MRYREILKFAFIGLVAGLVSMPATAQVESDGYYAYRERMTAPEDTYYLFDAERKEVASYDEARILRICVGDSRHVVPLKIHHDDMTAQVDRNDCIRVEAREVSLEPMKRLGSNEVIVARAQTLD